MLSRAGAARANELAKAKQEKNVVFMFEKWLDLWWPGGGLVMIKMLILVGEG